MPSLCNVFLFCATALGSTQQHRENEEQTCEPVSYTGRPFEQVAELMKVTPPNTRHSHISYVQVGPDFIHWGELQRAGIQDEL